MTFFILNKLRKLLVKLLHFNHNNMHLQCNYKVILDGLDKIKISKN